MEFLKATKNDLEAIYELNILLAKSESSYNRNINSSIPRDEFLKQYSEKFDKDMCNMIIAKEGDTIIGYIFGWIEETNYLNSHKDRGFIGECYVLDEHRGKNIGTELFENISIWFKENKVDNATVEVLSNNSAEEFWRKNGFNKLYVGLSKSL